jgi:PTH1 family peptidyl-tRNA hydrolase
VSEGPFLVVGLGNPGPSYAGNRHNVGAMVLDELAARAGGLLDYHSVPATHLVVLHDELDIPFGTVRLKRGGGEGGHNGVRSISRSTGTKDYLRVRVGIGRPPGRQDPADFVLKDFSATERRELDLLVAEAADAAEELLALGLEAAQNVVHPRT